MTCERRGAPPPKVTRYRADHRYRPSSIDRRYQSHGDSILGRVATRSSMRFVRGMVARVARQTTADSIYRRSTELPSNGVALVRRSPDINLPATKEKNSTHAARARSACSCFFSVLLIRPGRFLWRRATHGDGARAGAPTSTVAAATNRARVTAAAAATTVSVSSPRPATRNGLPLDPVPVSAFRHFVGGADFTVAYNDLVAGVLLEERLAVCLI